MAGPATQVEEGSVLVEEGSELVEEASEVLIAELSSIFVTSFCISAGLSSLLCGIWSVCFSWWTVGAAVVGLVLLREGNLLRLGFSTGALLT